MKDYVNFEGLSYFFNRLIEKFSSIGHTHTKADISDLQDLIVKVITLEEEVNTLTTNLNVLDGNVDTLISDVNALKTDVITLKSVVNDNDILVCK